MSNYLKRNTDNSSHHISTPDSVALSIIGDIDIRLGVNTEDFTGETDSLFSKANNGTSNERLYVDVLSGEAMRIIWKDAAGTVNVVSSTADLTGVYTVGGALHLRWTLDVDNGATGHDVTFYYSTEPADTNPVTWTQLGNVVTNAGVTDIEDTDEPIKLGWNDRFAYGNFLGGYYYFELRDGIGGTVVADPDMRDDSQGDWQAAIGGGTVTDGQGNVWTVNGSGWEYVEAGGSNLLLLGVG